MIEPDQTAETYEEPSSSIADKFLHNPVIAALLRVAHNAVIIVDKEMRVVAANPSAYELFFFPPEDDLPRLVDITRNRDIYYCFKQATEAEHLFERKIELHVGTKERSLNAKITSILLPTEDSENTRLEPIGAVGTFFDTTKVEQLEKTRREFFANLSHELRTPLTSIQTYAETLLSGAIYDTDNNIKFLKVIAKQADRMQRLAKDISDLAAIESGKVNLKPKNLKLLEVVKEVTDLLKDPLAAKQILLEIKVAQDFTVYSDHKALEQILFNLIQNACNFNKPAGSITIEAEISERYKIVKVSDTGIGIEPKHLPRIFERLYRVDDSRRRKDGGTGLGLAIVKHLVQSQGGTISVESFPTKGTTFTVSLPNISKK
ncbi:MAG: hypothetical protein JNN15_17640 [Blastocatellia bacterium]|nr:hypothetical protein [Blastocatellia bacterium]